MFDLFQLLPNLFEFLNYHAYRWKVSDSKVLIVDTSCFLTPKFRIKLSAGIYINRVAMAAAADQLKMEDLDHEAYETENIQDTSDYPGDNGTVDGDSMMEDPVRHIITVKPIGSFNYLNIF